MWLLGTPFGPVLVDSGHEVLFCNFPLFGVESAPTCPNSGRFGKISQDISSKTTPFVDLGDFEPVKRGKGMPEFRKNADFQGGGMWTDRQTDRQTDRGQTGLAGPTSRAGNLHPVSGSTAPLTPMKI